MTERVHVIVSVSCIAVCYALFNNWDIRLWRAFKRWRRRRK